MTLAHWRDRYHAAHPARARIMGAIRQELGGDSDLWGSAMGWRFAIAETIYHSTDAPIPPSWQYRDGMGCAGNATEVWPDAEVFEMFDAGETDTEALLYAGAVLERYTAWLRLAGLDY